MPLQHYSRIDILTDQAKASAATLQADKAAHWIARLDELRNECGCSTGMRFFLATLVIYPIVWFWYPFISSPWFAALTGIFVLLLAAGFGKLTGVLVARYRLRRTIHDLHFHLSQQ